MNRLITLLAALSLCLSAVSPGAARADDRDKAALAALLAVGIGIAAIAAHKKDKDDKDWDYDRYGEPFSPHSGVVCLPKIRKCYKNDHFSARWTERIFGSEGLGEHVSWQGSFAQSCRRIDTDRDGNLRAECRNERGRWKDAFLAERSCRSHRAGNEDGRLICLEGGGFSGSGGSSGGFGGSGGSGGGFGGSGGSGGGFGGSGGSGGSHQGRWGGSFLGSCRDVQVDGSSNLRASCMKANGRYERAYLGERQCRAHRAGNDNGRLVCEG